MANGGFTDQPLKQTNPISSKCWLLNKDWSPLVIGGDMSGLIITELVHCLNHLLWPALNDLEPTSASTSRQENQGVGMI